MLLLRANLPCDSYWLCEAVWEAAPTHPRPMNALHVCMNRLRTVLSSANYAGPVAPVSGLRNGWGDAQGGQGRDSRCERLVGGSAP